MTDHLPECVVHGDRLRPMPCICPELRACEQRVKEREERGNLGDRARARREALDAARDAVAALPYEVLELDGETDEWLTLPDALAAIDALREQQ